MGDRTWLEVIVHPDDIEHDGWQEWLRHMGETSGERFEDLPNAWDCEEINYGGYSDLENLAATGVRFVGCHGQGYDYSAQVFFADGQDKTVHYSPPDTWDTYRMVVKCANSECLDIDVKDLDQQFNLIQRYQALNEEIWAKTREQEND